jgi:multidrug efflux system membrane fusion protein
MKGTYRPKSVVALSPAAVVVAATVLLVATGCGRKKEETPKEIVRPVKVFTLGEAAGKRTMDLPGETRAIKQAVLAFEVSGRISELLVKEGDVVKAGQVLARLDPRDLKAQFDAATARRDAAKPKMERADILAQKNAVSKQYFEEAKREYEVAVADLAQAQKALDDTMLKADFDGVVAKVFLKRYENVAAKQEVLVLQDTSEIEVAVNIPESLVATSRPNRTLDEITERAKPVIELTAVPGRRFPARITEASQRADPATRTYEAKVVFAPPHDLTILPGMTAKVIAQVQPDAAGAAGAFRVPSNAIASEPDGKPFVWRLDPKAMTVSKVPVTTGQASGSMVEISGELAAGDEIVISGVPQLRAGMKVSRWQGNDSGRP